MFIKRFTRKLVPPILFDMLHSFKSTAPEAEPLWKGPFENWKTAASQAKGYDDQFILQKVRNALIKVKTGEVAYERDSVLFDQVQYAWPLLACLENIALANNNQLHVIDFGGSLGSTYFQNRHFLNHLHSFKWVVVEQKHFNDCGRLEFQNETLQFEDSIESALSKGSFHCLVLSSVLQYLPNPFEFITRFNTYNFDYILIDRTGFIDNSSTTLTVQTVPPEIYDASYPCWFFNEIELVKHFLPFYSIIADFDDSFTQDIIVNKQRCYWKGFYLKRK